MHFITSFGGMGATALWLMLLLGAWHGVNPGMGWLFAVALGMQEQRARAVAKALIPIALGHALAIGAVLGIAALLGMALPQDAIRYTVAALLFCLGIYSLFGHHHPRWVRMQVGFADLTLWSFLMATAHGAGLMVLPVVLGSSTVEAAGATAAAGVHASHAADVVATVGQMAGHHHTAMTAATGTLAPLLATAVHTAAYLAVTGLIAWIVYRKLGLAILRKAWLNLNVVWAAALVITSLVTLLM